MKTILSVLFILLSISIYPAELNINLSKEECKVFSFKVMESIKDEDFDKAFEMLKDIWPIPENELLTLKVQTIKQLDMVKYRFGKTLDVLLVEENEIDNTLIKLVYIIKYEYHITRWKFIFYKPKDSWILNSFKWDDSVDNLFNKQ